ncbi:MAG: hypothetical protein ACYDHX_16265 [Methanothrix sp.]
MAAATQTAPHTGQIKQIACISRTGIENLLSVEQIPGGYQLPFATIYIAKEAKERMEAKDLAEAAS